MKFGGVVENHKLKFNWHMTSALCHNDVITVKILNFYKILLIKVEKFRDVSDFKKIYK